MLACARVCPARCHARFSAASRTYYYRLHAARGPPALQQRAAVWHVRPARGDALDLAAMREAAALLIGRHDFSAFRGAGCGATSPLRTLSRLEVHPAAPWAPHPAPPPWLPLQAQLRAHLPAEATSASGFVITAEAPSFLYRQVRCLAGCLAAVGAGRVAARDVAAMLAARDPSRCPPPAPPHGLYLAHVAYAAAALAAPEGAHESGGDGGRRRCVEGDAAARAD